MVVNTAMDIKQVIENVVSLFANTAPHDWTVQTNTTSSSVTRPFGTVHLPNDKELKERAMMRHFEHAREKYMPQFKQHVEGPYKVQHTEAASYVYHWLDHPTDENQNVVVVHRFKRFEND